MSQELHINPLAVYDHEAYTLGSIGTDHRGFEYVFCLGEGNGGNRTENPRRSQFAITDTFSCQRINSGNDHAGLRVGVSLHPVNGFNVGDYVWMCIYGQGPYVGVQGAAPAHTVLRVGSNWGALRNSGSHSLVDNIYLTEAAGGNGQFHGVWHYPRFRV